jgi:response regulator of citrate/malate metabolism
MSILVLIVEDEAIAAEAHANYVERLPAFELAGVARSAQEAIRAIESVPIDLILLDLHLPDGHGLDLLRQIRAAGHHVDVIAVTSARDVDVVRHAVAQGVVAYLLKPFTFAGFRLKLEQYAAYWEQFHRQDGAVGQSEVDEMLNSLRPAARNDNLPKGMSAETLADILAALKAEPDRPYSATEMATVIGSSRVTARRYLEYLAEVGTTGRSTRFGKAGRPEVEYALL